MACDKKCHSTRKAAEQAAYAIKAKGLIGCRDSLYPYFCKSCNAFHLSKMNNEKWFHSLK